MKHFYFIIIALFAFVASCSKPTKEELIEKAFIEYVNQNFDDPNSLKEIISISTEDTLSATKTISFVENLLVNSDSTIEKITSMNDSLRNVENANFEAIKKSPRLTSKYYGDKVGLGILTELINHGNKEVEYLTSNEFQTLKLKRTSLEEAIKTLKKDSTFIVTYEIKTRIVGKDKELEIKKFYAQTTIDNTINIFDNNSLNLYPSIYQETYKEAETYTELYLRRSNMLLEKSNILRRAINYYRVD